MRMAGRLHGKHVTPRVDHHAGGQPARAGWAFPSPCTPARQPNPGARSHAGRHLPFQLLEGCVQSRFVSSFPIIAPRCGGTTR